METLILNENININISSRASNNCINKLNKLNQITDRLATLKIDIENNIPHALFWYEIMLKRQKEAKTAYKSALRATLPRVQRAPKKKIIINNNIKINYLDLPENLRDSYVNDECAICFEKELIKNTILTECNHRFCFICFETWKKNKMVLSINNVNCPCCRTICKTITAYKK